MNNSSYLLDVNTLIALTWPNHVHHNQVHHWFGIHAQEGWATCPLTQCAFVRISSNPGIIAEAATPAHALSILKELVKNKYHVFWPEEVDISKKTDIPASLFQGHRQITDAYLLLLAEYKNGKLATLDSRLLHAVKGSKLRERVELIGAV